MAMEHTAVRAGGVFGLLGTVKHLAPYFTDEERVAVVATV